MLVNNGKYRRSLLVMRKFFNDVESFTGGFPIDESILSSFAEYTSLSPEDFQSMTEANYQLRLSAFYNYMSLTYPFFNATNSIPDVSNEDLNSHGDDSDYCPLDYPNAVRSYLSLEVTRRVDGADFFATIIATLKDSNGQPITFPFDFYFDWILKEADGIPLIEWDQTEGDLLTELLSEGESSVVLAEEFQYRGDGELLSVQIQLMPLEETSEVYIFPTKKVTVTSADPAYLFNHISNIQQAYQDMIDIVVSQENVDNANGIRILGKTNYTFIFDANQPKRPVFIYPKSWGKLSEIVIVQEQNMNIINDGTFLFNTNGEPFEQTLQIEGVNVQCYVYASKAMIIYPYKVDYQFKFA